MKKIFITMILILLLSSCSPSEIPPTNTLTPPPTETSIPTSTETPLPTFTFTPTLAPIAVNCVIEDKISTEDDCNEIREAIQIGRRYLIAAFGKDVINQIDVKLFSNPNMRSSEGPGSYGANQDDPSKPKILINTFHDFWASYQGPEYLYRRQAGVIHEITHIWQLEQGCLVSSVVKDPLLDFLVEGQAEYAAYNAIGKPEEINQGQAIVLWTHVEYKENAWFNFSEVAALAIKDLTDRNTTASFTQYCKLVKDGIQPRDAFQKLYGITVEEFRKEFNEKTLGLLAECTEETCGSGEGEAYDTLKSFTDFTLTEPNLIVNFSDETGNPVSNPLIQVCILAEKNLVSCTYGGDPNLDAGLKEPGKFIAALKVGKYYLRMCEPDYPRIEYEANPIKCVYSTQPFEIEAGITKIIDFQFHGITNSSADTNFIFKLFSSEGDPVLNQYIQICLEEIDSRICLNTNTDDTGVFKASLLEGDYTIKLVLPGQGYLDPRGKSNPNYGMDLNSVYLPTAEYEIKSLTVKNGDVSEYSYKYPKPNLIINFRDAVGGPLSPNQVFWLCRDGDLPATIDSSVPFNLITEIHDIAEASEFCLLLGQADESATFKTKLPTGTYHVYFNALRHWAGDNDYELADIHVMSETEVTEITFQLK